MESARTAEHETGLALFRMTLSHDLFISALDQFDDRRIEVLSMDAYQADIAWCAQEYPSVL